MTNDIDLILNIEHLPKNDYCYLAAVDAALAQRGNYSSIDTECLQELKHLFTFRIAMQRERWRSSYDER